MQPCLALIENNLLIHRRILYFINTCFITSLCFGFMAALSLQYRYEYSTNVTGMSELLKVVQERL